MTWGQQGQHGGPQGHGVETTETTETMETTAMETTWGPGGYGDDVGTMRITRG